MGGEANGPEEARRARRTPSLDAKRSAEGVRVCTRCAQALKRGLAAEVAEPQVIARSMQTGSTRIGEGRDET